MSEIPIDPAGKLIHLTQKERDVINDLWGLGLTVVPRTLGREIFDVPKPPLGWSYQWHDKPEREGWEAVSYDRHPGVFAPWGTAGHIEFSGLYLLERASFEVEAAHAASHAKARWNVDDWIKRQAEAGFSGSITVLGESESSRSAETVEIGAETTLSSKIPDDLIPHLAELLRERDRLVAAAIKASIDTLKPPNMVELRASYLQMAIDTIRKKYATRMCPSGVPCTSDRCTEDQCLGGDYDEIAHQMHNEPPPNRYVDGAEKTIEDMSLIPEYLRSKAADIFRVRDDLWGRADEWWATKNPTYLRFCELTEANPGRPRGKIMNEVLIPLAVEKVKEASNGEG